LCALALVASTAAADVDNPTAGQKQAFYAKPSVVRIVGVWEVMYSFNGREIKQYVGGTGSGFFVSADGFVATNAHVVQDIKEGEQKAKEKAAAAIMKELEQKLGGNREQIDAIASQIQFVKATEKAEIVLPDGTKLPYEIRAAGSTFRTTCSRSAIPAPPISRDCSTTSRSSRPRSPTARCRRSSAPPTASR